MSRPSNYHWCDACGLVRPRAPRELDPHWCPCCRMFHRRQTRLRPFTRDTWTECQRPGILTHILRSFHVGPSPRRARLLLVAFADFSAPAAGRIAPFRRALDRAAEWAETGTDPGGDPTLRQWLDKRSRLEGDKRHEYAYAAWALSPAPAEFGTPDRGPLPSLADAYRELFPNPFVGLCWNPDWFTATARDLAAHIHESRDFGAMPILADALQDSGCDDEQILSHCRGGRRHARGCWVLDAVLGKS